MTFEILNVCVIWNIFEELSLLMLQDFCSNRLVICGGGGRHHQNRFWNHLQTETKRRYQQ